MSKNSEFEQAAKRLGLDQQQDAMRNLVEDANEPEAGIMRQLLAEPDKPLTPSQQHVFDKYILPSMVEKCGGGCGGYSLSGVEFCDSCAIRFD